MSNSHGLSYSDAAPTFANAYLWPVLQQVIARREWPDKRAFDLGCGNGATCNMLSELGFDVDGIDVSESGVVAAQQAFPHVRVRLGSAYDDLRGEYGTYPLVVSLEVIEHCYDPRAFVKTFLDLLAPNGLGIVSTPYHGYLKNLALAASGKLDAHLGALWDGGHIKFFSAQTLTQIIREVSPRNVEILRVGRIAPFAKSMLAIVQ
jgi:2-polyprenyl-6-hydroxyphenyl methylase/3-demethylubiquinone-9 3-methyltransferase